MPLPTLALLAAIAMFAWVRWGNLSKGTNQVVFGMFATILLGILALLCMVSGFLAAWLTLKIKSRYLLLSK